MIGIYEVFCKGINAKTTYTKKNNYNTVKLQSLILSFFNLNFILFFFVGVGYRSGSNSVTLGVEANGEIAGTQPEDSIA